VKRGILILVGILLAGVAAAILAFCLSHQRHEEVVMTWLEKEYKLTPEQARQVETMHREYQVKCAQMCARIVESDTRLAALLRKNDHVTPEIRAAMEETDRVRTLCRVSMLEHLYQIADVMPPSEQKRYLEMVFPLIEHPEQMGTTHGLSAGGH